MNVKNIGLLFIILLLEIVISSCGTGGSGGAVKKRAIKVSHCLQADFSSELHTAAWIFQQWVNDHSETLEVRIYASNALGQERDVYEGMQLGGGASCALSGTAILNNFNKKIGVLDLPFLWRDYDHVHRVLDGEIGDVLADELAEQGFVVLAWMDSWGYRNVVTTSKEVVRPEDLKGLKIRTIQTPNYIAALNAMGSNATPMAFGEVYTSLQTGVLDGFEHNASIVKGNKFYEVAGHIALTRHLFGPVAFVFSKAEWDTLTDEEQRIIREGAIMARDIERALAPVREEEAMDFLKGKGMKIHEIDTAVFRKNAEKLQEELARECDAADLLTKIRDAE